MYLILSPFKWAVAVSLLGLMLSMTASAQQTGDPCTSQNLQISSNLPRYLSKKTRATGTVWWTGTWTWTMRGCKNRVSTTYSNNPTFGLQVGSTTPAAISGVYGLKIQSPTPPTARVLNGTPCTYRGSSTSRIIPAVWDVYFDIPGNSVCDFEITLTNSQIYFDGIAVSFASNGVDSGFQTPLLIHTGFVPQGYYLGLYPMFHNEYMYTYGLVYNNLTTNYDKNVTLVNATCSFSQQNVVVSLPTTTLVAMKNANANAGLTAFQTNLNCDPNTVDYNVQTTISYTPASGVVNAIENSATSSPATKAYIQVLNANKTALASGTSFVNTVSTSGGTVTNSFFARYVSAGNATAGSIKGVATLTLSYP